MTCSSVPGLDANSYRVADEFAMFAPRARSQELGRNEFMVLLVKQLENQNPLEPMKNEEFIAQLATFSSLEQLTDLNKRMDSMIAGQGQLINSQSLGLIGREVVADTGGKLHLGENGTSEIVASFSSAPAAARVEIRDAGNKLVRTITLDGATRGQNVVTWDGYYAPVGDAAPVKAAAGEYTFTVIGTDRQGKAVESQAYVAFKVDGVQVGSDGIALVSNGRTVAFADVVEIREPRAPAAP